jgi:hypothetical protein
MDNYTFVSLEAIIEELGELCLYPEEHEVTYSDISSRIEEAQSLLNEIQHFAANKYNRKMKV